MIQRTPAFLLALALLGAPALGRGATTPLGPRDAAVLLDLTAPGNDQHAKLRNLRGGRVDVAPLRTDEKATLRSAQEQSPALAELKAGDGAGIIVVALLVIVLLILI